MKMKEVLGSVKDKVNGRVVAMSASGAGLAVLTSATAFATGEPAAGTPSLPTVAITTDMLSPLVEGVVENISVILPVGLGLFAIMLGIRIIPGVMSRFLRM